MRTAPGITRIFVPLPGWRPDRIYWSTVKRCVLWGPLLGGLPYNLFILPIPFSYALGALPAFIGGLFYALWRHAPSLRPPGAFERMLFGALCGAAGLVVCVALLHAPSPRMHGYGAFLLLPFAAFGGAATALSERADKPATNSVAPPWFKLVP